MHFYSNILLISVSLLQLSSCRLLITKPNPSLDHFSHEDFSLEANSFEDRPTDHAKVAREIVHKSEWAAFGTISTLQSIKGYPMVNVISIADSKKGANSTGHIYFYLTNLDFTAQDLMRSNRLTLLFSNDEDMACSRNSIDPMEPTCPRVMFAGLAEKLVNGTSEYTFANDAFMSHHPAAAKWIVTHDFFLCKLVISEIIVLDWYGGPHNVSKEDYYNVILTNDARQAFELDQRNLNGFNEMETNNLDEETNVISNNHNHHIKIKINKKREEIDIEI